MAESTAEAPQHGVLVVRGDVDEGFTWSIDRGDGVTLGEDEVLATAATDPADEAVVDELLTSSTTSDGARLRALGVRHVLLTDPADGRLAAVLDATPGLTPTGADPGARAWQVDGDDPAASTVAGPGVAVAGGAARGAGPRAARHARARRADDPAGRHRGRGADAMTVDPQPGPPARRARAATP